MKHKLLSLFALAGAMFMSTSAWAVDPPTEVIPAYDAETWVAPEDGGVYFIYNVGAAQFLGAGNNWGTHVVTATPDEEAGILTYYWNDAVALSGDGSAMNSGMVLPFKMTKTEDGNWYIEHMGTSRTACYLSSEADNSWIDCGTDRRIDFIIAETDGGYTIQATNTVEDATYFGAVDQDQAPEEGTPYVRNVMNNVTAETGYIVWKFAKTNYEAYDKYESVLALYNEIVVAEEAGVDASAAIAVYENEASTKEQLALALTALKALVNRAKFETEWAVAAEDNPLDVTADCLENPTFDEGVEGWFITVTGQNLGWQKRTDTNPNTGQQITNFIEAWIPSGSVLGDGVIAQTVYGLPAGKYVLECDATACHDPAGEADITGVNVFIQAGALKATAPVNTIRLGVEHFIVTFINDGSDEMTFGLEVAGTNANWISADNFKITYYGKTEQSIALATLTELVKKAEAVDIESTYALATAKTAFTAALTKAQQDIATEAGDEAYEQDATALSAAQAALETSAKEYEALKALIDKVAATSEDIAEQWPDLADQLDEWAEETLTPAYEDGTYTADDIAAAELRMPEIIREFIAEPGNIQAGDKLTLLIENADFSSGSGATNIPGWTIKSGAITELSASYHNIEAYHKTFDFSQTIQNMPKGAYKLKVQGFVRLDGTNTADHMVLYAGINKTAFKTIKDEYSLYPLLGTTKDEETGLYTESTGAWPYDSYFTTDDGETAYVPNSMQGANEYFSAVNPMTGQPFYLNEVTVILAEDGDLVIGVSCDVTDMWILWDNFELEYVGNEANLYEETINTMVEELQDLATADDAFITAKAAQLIDELPAQAETVIGNDDADECIAFIQTLQEAIAYVEEGNTKGAQLITQASIFQDYLVDEITSGYNDFLDLLDNIAGYVDDATVVADNDAIDAISASLKAEWGKFVMYDVTDASEEAPVDVTPVILNYDYTNYGITSSNANYWTTDSVSAPGFQSFAEAEFFNCNYRHSQKLEGLKAGYYTLSVDGFYRAGYPADYTDSLAAVCNAVLFAESAEGTFTTPMLNAIVGALSEEESLGVGSTSTIEGLTVANGLIPNNMEAAFAYIEAGLYSDNAVVAAVGEDGVLTIGLKKSNKIDGDWTIFTNWKLAYLGTEAPTAVKDITSAAAAGQMKIYSINGTEQTTLRRGVNIIRMTDGSVRKVLVK